MGQARERKLFNKMHREFGTEAPNQDVLDFLRVSTRGHKWVRNGWGGRFFSLPELERVALVARFKIENTKES